MAQAQRPQDPKQKEPEMPEEESGKMRTLSAPTPQLASSLSLFLRCKSVTPVGILKELILVLHGNDRLTHLNLSSIYLGITVYDDF
ncbi:NACHT, LRR and PYD domains-containing protein 13 [Pteropus alecto]|uniref:NACHT, LRR and PYD domains-containing protein 13 n=1 Tax=Pteropus alecto TaxID=9402 RepID=L5KC68_PTEAL|nr:NACHT, LRR and PYD domains-containing protein 13 [Pteropus alecto]